jgi:hypothetical protein
MIRSRKTCEAVRGVWIVLAGLCWPLVLMGSQDDAGIQPFGRPKLVPEGALPGRVVFSNRQELTGELWLTRDVRLSFYETKRQTRREIPLQAIRRIDCTVQREWMEREWRFKENASDEKVYTGRSYPVREYHHTIELKDGRKLEGTLAGLVHVMPAGANAARKMVLRSSDKGPAGTDLKGLVYVRSIEIDRPREEEATRGQPEEGSQAPPA